MNIMNMPGFTAETILVQDQRPLPFARCFGTRQWRRAATK